MNKSCNCNSRPFVDVTHLTTQIEYSGGTEQDIETTFTHLASSDETSATELCQRELIASSSNNAIE